VIVWVPMLKVVAGLAVSAPLPENTKLPVGLATTPEGALSWTAAPLAPITGVLQVVSWALQVLPDAAC
jgi:hypothetical protein